MSDTSSVPSSPLTGSSTPATSIPSPAIDKLVLNDDGEVTEEAKAEALKLKSQANEAFKGSRLTFGMLDACN